MWLGGRDSNPDTVVQSHVSYRWTTSQHGPDRAAETPIISGTRRLSKADRHHRDARTPCPARPAPPASRLSRNVQASARAPRWQLRRHRCASYRSGRLTRRDDPSRSARQPTDAPAIREPLASHRSHRSASHRSDQLKRLDGRSGGARQPTDERRYSRMPCVPTESRRIAGHSNASTIITHRQALAERRRDPGISPCLPTEPPSHRGSIATPRRSIKRHKATR